VGLASEVASATVERARDALSELWAASGARECGRAVTGRYPFAPQAGPEVTLDDFSRLFGPGGVFEAFFEENLAGFVDRSTDPWSWTGGLGTAGGSSDALAQFQRAAAIREAFFAAGGPAPEVDVTLDLVRLDPGARVAVVEIGGDRSVHGLDRAERETLTWPGEGITARLTVLPGGRDAALTETGEWAPFRLFDRAATRPLSDNRFEAAYEVARRDVVLTVTAGSVNNPFRLPAIEAFRCPETLLE
jgi:type VI secretion system protein ImpL